MVWVTMLLDVATWFGLWINPSSPSRAICRPSRVFVVSISARMSAPHSHRPTGLKQKNKSFKSRHATKSSLKTQAKGRMGRIEAPSHSSHKKQQVNGKGGDAKRNRLNQRAQLRESKRTDLQRELKFFSTASGGTGAPRIVSIVPLHDSIDTLAFVKTFLESLAAEEEITLSSVGSCLIRSPRYKTNIHLQLLPHGALYPTLDAALASDYVVFLLSSSYEVEPREEAMLRTLQSMIGGGSGGHGGPEIVAAVQAPVDDPLTPQTRPGVLKSLLSFTNYFFPSVPKVHVAARDGSSADASNLARAICEDLPAGARSASASGRGNDGRGWIVAEEVAWHQSQASDSDDTVGLLSVTGTIRGGRLSADRLVHIPGWGDYQLDAIRSAPRPTARRGPAAVAMETSNEVISTPGEEADDLTAFNEVDTMANEQTWPTEEEMMGAQEHAEKPRTKRVPKGMGAYQAAWIADEEDGEEDEEEREGSDDDDMQDMEDDIGDAHPSAGFGRETRAESVEEETEEIELESRAGDRYDDLDEEEEERQLEAYRRQRSREDNDDLHFPDEVDTPRNIPARTRFQRYRGLQSFRTSPWDPYEDLPLDYARIFQFENYERTRRRAEEAGREEGVAAGTRVELLIRNVPQRLYESRNASLPLVVYGLLQHEHKQSVLHFAVQRNTEYEEPVRAKEPLILCVGPRRYRVNPIYSQHTHGGGKGVNNVHKSERYLRHGGAVVATTYGPVVFGKQSCVLLRENQDDLQAPHLVAMGSFLSADPTRIIAKRIILTGHPFKVHKKTATVRYMFFDREDIHYFGPIELHTKYGRTGHIKEPLGTHGYFKAHFDGPIQQMDTVCMSLYKRQYPKAIEYFTPPPVSIKETTAAEEASMDME